jgi:hypothetical protein
MTVNDEFGRTWSEVRFVWALNLISHSKERKIKTV